MIRSNVKTYRYRVGKNHYIIIKVNQLAVGRTEIGNVLASNAVNVQILKKRGRR